NASAELPERLLVVLIGRQDELSDRRHDRRSVLVNTRARKVPSDLPRPLHSRGLEPLADGLQWKRAEQFGVLVDAEVPTVLYIEHDLAHPVHHQPWELSRQVHESPFCLFLLLESPSNQRQTCDSCGPVGIDG